MSSADAARSEGVRAALAMGAAEVMQGKTSFGAEVSVEEDGKIVRRSVVAVSASPIQSRALVPDEE
jgi:hypothetical protein